MSMAGKVAGNDDADRTNHVSCSRDDVVDNDDDNKKWKNAQKRICPMQLYENDRKRSVTIETPHIRLYEFLQYRVIIRLVVLIRTP